MNEEADKDFLEKYRKWERGEIDQSFMSEHFKLMSEEVDKTYLEKYLKSLSPKERTVVENYLQKYEPELRNLILLHGIESNWVEPPAYLKDTVMHNYQTQEKLQKSFFGKVFPSLANEKWLIKLVGKYIFRKA